MCSALKRSGGSGGGEGDEEGKEGEEGEEGEEGGGSRDATSNMAKKACIVGILVTMAFSNSSASPTRPARSSSAAHTRTPAWAHRSARSSSPDEGGNHHVLREAISMESSRRSRVLIRT